MMQRLKDRVAEVEEIVEFVREVFQRCVGRLKEGRDVQSLNLKWLKEDLMDLLILLNKYVELLIKMKKEFSDIYTETTDDIIELVWDIRILDEEDRKEVKEFVKRILKEKYGGSKEEGKD